VRIAWTALLAALVLAAAGCGGGGNKSATKTTTTTTTNLTGTWSVTTHGRFHYSSVLVDNFMQSCAGVDKAAKEAYCACTLDKLSNNVSTRDFARIGLSRGKVPPRIRRLIRQAAGACANKP
jgi:hypothetical protein